jgi:hypothetical protein
VLQGTYNTGENQQYALGRLQTLSKTLLQLKTLFASFAAKNMVLAVLQGIIPATKTSSAH